MPALSSSTTCARTSFNTSGWCRPLQTSQMSLSLSLMMTVIRGRGVYAVKVDLCCPAVCMTIAYIRLFSVSFHTRHYCRSRLVPPSAPTLLLTLLIMLCVSVCTDRSDVDTVCCCCNIESHFGKWFHVDCVNLDILPAADELWWCSDDCCRQHQLRMFCELKN